MKLILKKPVITEKSSKLQEQNNQYTFLVDKDANKIEIAKAIEEKFSVHVESVNTIISLGATKRVGKYIGKKNDFKKAIVTLKKDEKIQLFQKEQ
jgi:large subunit ribosomal protein L23